MGASLQEEYGAKEERTSQFLVHGFLFVAPHVQAPTKAHFHGSRIPLERGELRVRACHWF
jgi:hypothetical protein